jgi:hypothetical protein
MVAADGMTKTIIAQYVNVASGRHRILCCSLCYDLCVIYLAISALDVTTGNSLIADTLVNLSTYTGLRIWDPRPLCDSRIIRMITNILIWQN